MRVTTTRDVKIMMPRWALPNRIQKNRKNARFIAEPPSWGCFNSLPVEAQAPANAFFPGKGFKG
jgi:hypothetical protein